MKTIQQNFEIYMDSSNIRAPCVSAPNPSFTKTPTVEARYIKTVVTNTIKSNLLCIFSPLGTFLTLCNLFM